MRVTLAITSLTLALVYLLCVGVCNARLNPAVLFLLLFAAAICLRRFIRKRVGLCAVLFFCGSLQAATHTAASASRADVGTAYDATSDGDTLAIPAGTSRWTTGLTVEKAITIRGAGTNESGGTVLMSDADISIFTLSTQLKTQSVFRIADMTIMPGTVAANRIIAINGCNTNQSFFVVSNMLFKNTQNLGVFISGAIGVFKRVYFNTTNAAIFGYVWHPNWSGALVAAGSFYDPVQYGSVQMVWYEDCVFDRNAATYAATDAYQGARYGVRFSFLTNCWLEWHGTESAFTRGARSGISYGNVFHGNGLSSYAHNFRSGTGIIYSNTVVNVPSAANFAQLSAYRAYFQATPWGQSNGQNPADVNDPTIYDSGTATAGTTNSLTDSTKMWDNNEWVGYELVRNTPIKSGYTSLTDYRAGYITANTATTITTVSGISGDFFTNVVFLAGDTYEIRKIDHSYDMPGGGNDDVFANWRLNDSLTVSANVASCTLADHGFTTGDYIVLGELQVGATSDITTMAQVTVTSSSAYNFPLYVANGDSHPVYRGLVCKVSNTQTIDPSYEWDNTVNGSGTTPFAAAQTFIVENTHFHNQTVKPGYVALEYPHPLASGGSPETPTRFSIPGTVRVGTLKGGGQ